MRFHHLEICAFGPFAGTESVDFDALSADGLFLLRGQTGSGKTSVLDAITFALYGDVPGPRRNDGLKSQHAPADRKPYVELEFSRGEDRFHVRREPRYLRPAKRAGAADQSEGPALFIKRFEHGVWKQIPVHKVAEGDKELSEVLGLDMAEFTKVIMLPQGAFAQLMHASNEDRRRILEQLFDISTYEQLEHYLWERKRESESRLNDLDSKISVHEGALRRSAEALLGDRAPQTVELSAADLPGPLLAEVAGHIAELYSAEQEAKAAAEQSRQQAEELKSRHRQLTAWDDHCRRRALQEESGPQAEQARARLHDHTAASAVQDWLEQADSATAQAHKLEDGAAEAETAAHQALEVQSDLAARTVEAAAGELSELRARLTDDDAITAEQRHADLVSAAREAEQALVEARKQKTELSEALERTRQLLEADRATLLGPEEVDAVWDAARAAAATAERRVEQVAHRDQASAEVQQLTGRISQQQIQLEQEQEAYRGASAGHLQSLAHELAQRLDAGQPCLVCGSAEHPNPLRVGADTVTREQVEAVAESLQQTRAEWERLQAAHRAARERLDTARKELEEAAECSAEESAQLKDEAHQQVLAAETLRAEQTALRKRIDHATQKQGGQREDLIEVQHRIERESSEEARLAKEVQALELRMSQLRGSHHTVQERVAALDRLHTVLRTAQQARRDAEAADLARRGVRDSATQQLEKSPFSTAAEVTAALLDDSGLTLLQGQVENHDQTEQKLRYDAESADVLAGQELAAEGRTTPTGAEVQEVSQAAEQAQQSAVAAHRRLTDFQAEARGVQRAADDLRQALVERETQAAEQMRRAELAKAVNGQGGDNERRMRLTTFVLAARLERVAEAASRHLRAMTDGRYQLLLDADRGGRGLRGLDLKVHDEQAEQQRPAESLSGGETFMAALSLALGLAEMVQSESGGIGLESLFIDEGFGSLDEQTLESVMTALHTLQGEGRRIGVVSHVTEMHQQIPVQLKVTKTLRGSSLGLVGTS